MFELNLIKDKQKARQRRQIIFLSISGIFLLSGLLSIFVGGLFWQALIRLDSKQTEIDQKTQQADRQAADLKVRAPAAKERRNALIRAWNEDSRVLKDRPYFATSLMELARHRPANAEFWYNSISISPLDSGRGPRGTASEDETANLLLEGRVLEAQGYIEIEASHIMTEGELKSLTSRMSNLRDLVGPPQFNVDEQNEIMPGGGGDSSKYMPFTMAARQTMFRSASE